MRKLTQKDFITRLKEIHGDLYDCSEVNYINARTKVKLFCKKHKIWFEITPDSILSKKCGCPICRYEKSAEKMKTPVEEFIKRANEVHNGKYDYSKVGYTNNRTKVCIICKEHGEFWQTPDKHILRKHGCPICGGSAKRTTESFINDAKKVHGDKYDYSKSEYNGTHTPLIIICPIHGEFSQAPNDHLHGQGCPHCKQSKIENEVRNMLEENNMEFTQQYKYDETNRKNKLDFFLPNKNVAIECQGEQHFKPVDFANNGKEWAEELFEKNIQRDVYKNQLCKDKGIRLLYYVPKSNTVPGYKSSSKFCGLYTNENVYNNLNQLKEGVSFDDI
jgi:hypothetical protein